MIWSNGNFSPIIVLETANLGGRLCQAVGIAAGEASGANPAGNALARLRFTVIHPTLEAGGEFALWQPALETR